MMVAPIQHGSRYRFRLADVICPDRQEVLTQITAELEVAGELTLVSDSGDESAKYAVIEVEGIPGPLIVPVERLAEVAASDLEPRYERVILEK